MWSRGKGDTRTLRRARMLMVAGMSVGLACAPTVASAQSIYRFDQKAPPPRRQGEDVRPYITCTAPYDVDGVRYVYSGHFAQAEWTGRLKFYYAAIYTQRRADSVQVDRAMVLDPGPAPVLRTYYAQSYKVVPGHFMIEGGVLRLARAPKIVTQVFDTRRGRWVERLPFLRSDGNAKLESRHERDRAVALTRPFTVGIAVDGGRPIYTARFSPDPRRETAVVARLFSVGRERFESKPLDFPGCINDATGKPTRRR